MSSCRIMSMCSFSPPFAWKLLGVHRLASRRPWKPSSSSSASLPFIQLRETNSGMLMIQAMGSKHCLMIQVAKPFCAEGEPEIRPWGKNLLWLSCQGQPLRVRAQPLQYRGLAEQEVNTLDFWMVKLSNLSGVTLWQIHCQTYSFWQVSLPLYFLAQSMHNSRILRQKGNLWWG